MNFLQIKKAACSVRPLVIFLRYYPYEGPLGPIEHELLPEVMSPRSTATSSPFASVREPADYGITDDETRGPQVKIQLKTNEQQRAVEVGAPIAVSSSERRQDDHVSGSEESDGRNQYTAVVRHEAMSSTQEGNKADDLFPFDRLRLLTHLQHFGVLGPWRQPTPQEVSSSIDTSTEVISMTAKKPASFKQSSP